MVAEQWQGGAAAWERLHERVAHRFGRVEVRARVRRYLAGLLGRVERKNGWPLAEALGEVGPRACGACSPTAPGVPRRSQMTSRRTRAQSLAMRHPQRWSWWHPHVYTRSRP